METELPEWCPETVEGDGNEYRVVDLRPPEKGDLYYTGRSVAEAKNDKSWCNIRPIVEKKMTDEELAEKLRRLANFLENAGKTANSRMVLDAAARLEGD